MKVLFDLSSLILEDTEDLQDTGIFGSVYADEYVGAEADFNNLETTMSVIPILTTRIHKDHPKAQIIRERRTNHKDFQNCLFACFLSQMEPKKVTQALDDKIWVEAMQEELLQFKLLNVWTLVDLPHGKKVIAIRLFLAFASFMGFTVYQMDVKSAFLYGTIEEEKFGFSNVKTTTTLMETNKPLLQDTAGTDMDVYLYKFPILKPKSFSKLCKKRIFRYLKGQPTLGLWYPKDLPMDLIAYSDSNYAGASIDIKSTTREYIVASNCCGQVSVFDCKHWEAHDVYYALKYDWKDLLHQTKSVKHIGKSKEVGTLRSMAPITHESSSPKCSRTWTDEGSVSLNELMDLVTQLTNKVGGLENELKNTKKVYGTTITKLAKRVKKLEIQVKTGKASRRTKIVLSEDEAVEEDSSKQGRILLPVTLPSVSTSTKLLGSLVYSKGVKRIRKIKVKGNHDLKNESVKRIQEARAEERLAGKKEVVTEVDTAHVIDWNDPSVIRYHALQNRPRSIAELWDQIHSFMPMDSEEEVPRLKREGQDVEIKPVKRQRTEEVLESVQKQTNEEPKTDELSQEQLNQMVIRCDNGTEFKNKEMNQFCERKGIKIEFSVARTPQQNEVDERKNITLIEAARIMLADSKLPTTFYYGLEAD
ncbi:putative ribonuclease H-like domain-containing protein [Tanacetum coccineum]